MSVNKETLCDNRKWLYNENPSLDLQSAKYNADFFGPALPPNFQKINLESKEKETFGPSLPDHFEKKEKDESNEVPPSILEQNDNLIGPKMPKYLTSKLISSEIEEVSVSSDVNYGPSKTLMATGDVINYYKFLNSQNFHKKTVNINESNIKRESWMIELPEKKKASFGLLRRHFKPQIQILEESDDSVWTDTPSGREKKKPSNKKKDHRESLLIKRLKERDKEMEKLAKKVTKKLKKKESLLEMHLKSMKKKKRKEKKREEEGKLLPERRPFDRNIDLQICKYKESHRRAIFNSGQHLKDRFAPGQSKFL